MSTSHGNSRLQPFRLPDRLFDGSLASLELLLGYVWERLAAKDPCHRCSGRKWRQCLPKPDRRQSMRNSDLLCGLRRDIMEPMGYLH